MPISGNSSYIPTVNEFIAHWESVDAYLGAGNEVIVAGGKSRADLLTLRTELQTKRDAVEGVLNGVEISSATIKLQKEALLERFAQLAANVRALYGGQAFEAALPDAPGLGDNESKFCKPLVDAANLWQRILDSGATLTLVDAFTVTDFNDAIDDLRQEYIAWTKGGSDLKIVRGERDDLQKQIYPILKQYRQIIPGKFPDDSVYINTLPRLTPKPGATPQAVNASAVWDEAEVKARIEWEASTNNDLKEYQVRYTPGDDYEEDDETIVATISPGQPLTLLTDAGLTQAGASSTFKVYVITNTGNEKGSAALTVEWPVA